MDCCLPGAFHISMFRFMNSFVANLRSLMTVFCMLAMVSTFVVSVGHVSSESEVVECEEFEAVATRRVNHRSDRDLSTGENAGITIQPGVAQQSWLPVSFRAERGQHNGIGTHLLA